MPLFDWLGKKRKVTFRDLMQGSRPVTIKDFLELDEIQCRPDMVAAARELLLSESHSHDGYNILGELASGGDAAAQFEMGDFCESVLNRPEQAAIWFQRSADQGIAAAQRNYADMLMVGKGVPQNPLKAKGYYEKAAKAGIPEAQFVMGEIFRCGIIVPKDDRQAISYYQQAFQQGYEGAGVRLKQFYPTAPPSQNP